MVRAAGIDKTWAWYIYAEVDGRRLGTGLACLATCLRVVAMVWVSGSDLWQ